MKLSRLLAVSTAAAALSLGCGSAFAQSTTGSIRGVVTGPDGSPVAGQTVTVTNELTGSSRTLTTNANGVFGAAGLSVSGEYTVRVDSNRFADQEITDLRLSLGETTPVSFSLADSTVDQIVVTASALDIFELSTGPSATYTADDLTSAPSVSREFKDLIRFDPRLNVDNTRGDGVSCGGVSNRFNSFTLNGLRLNDDFGLNSNGFPSERSPVTLEAIDQVVVEFAPFDVEFSDFSGCNINAVTKSGSNEIHGQGFYFRTGDSLRGDGLEGVASDLGEFEEDAYGGTISFPIWKDKIFFFGSYEKQSRTQPILFGPAGSGAAQEAALVSQANLDRVRDISIAKYDFDPLQLSDEFTVEDEKILAKVDFELIDGHRQSFTYLESEGSRVQFEDTRASSNRLTLPSRWYDSNQLLKSYVVQTFDDWTPNFSTEFRWVKKEQRANPNPKGGDDFAQINIVSDDGGFIGIGGDEFRHANFLQVDRNTFRLQGNYFQGNHSIKAGVEYDAVRVYNLFIQAQDGVYIFDTIDDFDAMQASSVSGFNLNFNLFAGPFQNSVTGDIQDAAAIFRQQRYSWYVQDDWQIRPDLLLTGGVRIERFGYKDQPGFNQNFFDRYGFRNDSLPDGEVLVLPRFGFNWEQSSDLTIRGGIGLFSGGDPAVWTSNSFTNDGLKQANANSLATIAANDPFGGDADSNGIPDVLELGRLGVDLRADTEAGYRPGYDVPNFVQNVIAGLGGDGEVNAMTQDFEPPQTWRVNLGADKFFNVPIIGDNFFLQADVMHSWVEKAIGFSILDAAVVGTAPDGRPLYKSRIDFLDPACAADPADSACSNSFAFRRTADDFLMSNVTEGYATTLSAQISKEWEFNWYDLDFNLGYANTRAKDVNAYSSSRATSNVRDTVNFDQNNPTKSTSDFELRHRLTFSTTFEKEFWNGFESRLTLFGQSFSGRPHSFVFNNNPFGARNSPQSLLYVPSGPGMNDDPLVRYEFDADPVTNQAILDHFNRVAETTGLSDYRGQIAERNAFRNPWTTRIDLRFAQEVPLAFLPGSHSGTFFLDIENFTNLLNDEWGVFREVPFGATGRNRSVAIVSADIDAATNQYVFTDFNDRIFLENESIYQRNRSVSQWQIQWGFRYEF